MGRLRDAIEVSTSSEEAHDILQHLRIHISSGVSRLGPCVWGHTHVVEGAERGVGVVLVLEDVQPCRCDVARLKCLHEGLFVDDGTRAVLMKIAVGFISASSRSPMKWCVSEL